MTHAVNWFEIPTTDLQRAKQFYSTVLQANLTNNVMLTITLNCNTRARIPMNC